MGCQRGWVVVKVLSLACGQLPLTVSLHDEEREGSPSLSPSSYKATVHVERGPTPIAHLTLITS